MRYVFVLLLPLVFGLVSCEGIDAPKKPKNLIPKNKMSDILEDVYILNAAKGTNRSVLEKNGLEPDTYIYEKYGIDSLQFVQSNEYYAFNIKTYEEILNRVKERLETAKDKFNDEMTGNENEISISEEDSIRRRRDASRKPIQLQEKLLEIKRRDSTNRD